VYERLSKRSAVSARQQQRRLVRRRQNYFFTDGSSTTTYCMQPTSGGGKKWTAAVGDSTTEWEASKKSIAPRYYSSSRKMSDRRPLLLDSDGGGFSKKIYFQGFSIDFKGLLMTIFSQICSFGDFLTKFSQISPAQMYIWIQIYRYMHACIYNYIYKTNTRHDNYRIFPQLPPTSYYYRLGSAAKTNLHTK
jgi:hypothetical protein